MHMPVEIEKLAQEVVAALKAGGRTIATAESCTGGLVAGALTSVSGSSEPVPSQMAVWTMKLSGAPPCQCHSPGGV